jgi:hypothetical protein
MGGLQLFWITAQADYTEHAVTDQAQTSGITTGNGLFEAICGVDFLAASMVAAPRNACSHCLSALWTRTQKPDISEQRRRRRPSWLGRLWWRGQPG